MNMYYIDDRYLAMLLKELSDLSREQLLRMKKLFETNNTLDERPVSVDQKRGQVGHKVVELLLLEKD
ncbi:MAG: hypothetical protein P1Q69_18370 [Candidatus Thorarchaeota archaeon]|nr:hypothetical protein [Candidatus Thorarchaeota archaeon]